MTWVLLIAVVILGIMVFKLMSDIDDLKKWVINKDSVFEDMIGTQADPGWAHRATAKLTFLASFHEGGPDTQDPPPPPNPCKLGSC